MAGPSRTAEIAQAVGISDSTARRRLTKLIERGAVVQVGGPNSPTARYELCEER
ncbi:winged helix-turn-helix domain-containing protein [Gordonibacter massiliensis]|uniref:Winged helix-turn-helix domain-containing protein n=1 Tax=Gordonibacter massiliensis (ex Traore et al. 2017) TaxID=1841863 RepID=A0A842JG42_9ACTN|nr:winged helix-turn-helix domain-containing protein [Gordonibacter massiliensis (ex Traore et al. 2017)]